MFAIDASAMMPWVFEDENHPVATEAARRAAFEEMSVPALWWFELRNALLMGERRKRSTPEKTRAFLARLGRLAVIIDRSAEELAIFDFARRHGLTVYDAAYLELAHRRSLALATLDSDLAKAARAERVELISAGH